MDSIINILPDDLLILIIAIYCTDLSKFVLHFVSKKFQMLTMDNKKNRDLGASFVMCFVRENGYYKERLCTLAANEGSLNILKWFRFNDYTWENGYYKKRLCTLAASEGSLNILKWFRFNDYTWDDDVWISAAEKGHLNILIYANDNGCPKYKYICEDTYQGYPLRNNEVCVVIALKNGHLEILKWLHKNNYLSENDKCVICMRASRWGRLEALKWACENNFPMEKNVCIRMAKQTGQSKIIEWLEHNC
jgi:hypothetical protein